MEYTEIKHVNKNNVVSFNGKEYHVVFTAISADHFADNFGSDPLHDVKAVDTLKILSKSIVVLLPNKQNKYVALGRHTQKVYSTFFRLEQNRLYLLSSYRCNRMNWIKFYKSYEKQ